MSDKLELEDLRIPRDSDGNPLPKYIETDWGKVGYKPQAIGDIEEFSELAKKDDDEADSSEVINILRKVVLEPDFSEVDDEELKSEFDFEKLRDLLTEIVTKVRGPAQQGEIKNLRRGQRG